MTTQFPSALDNFTNPTPSDNLNTPQVLHSDQHSNENDAIEAIEAWVGISGTSAQASHEYRIKTLEGKPFPQELIGIMGWDEGTPVGTGTVLNIVGSGGNLTRSGTVLNLELTSQAGGGGGMGVVGWDEGRFIGTGSILNVTETDLTLSRSGTVLELSRTTGTTFYLGVNGSRVWAYRASGTWLILTNSPDPQELIGVYNLSNGVPVGTGSMGTGTWIDWGNNLSVSMSGTTLRVNASAFPQEIIGIYGKDEGQNVGTGTILNVVGDNVSLSLSGTTLILSHSNTDTTDNFWTSGSGGDNSVAQRFGGADATGSYAVAMGAGFAGGDYSVAEGVGLAGGDYSHAEGGGRAVGSNSHAEGGFTLASGDNSHAEGFFSTASGTSSHSEGFLSSSIGVSSHSEGSSTLALGDGSHSEGDSTKAVGVNSHAGGRLAISSGTRSFAHGNNVLAMGVDSAVLGGVNSSLIANQSALLALSNFTGTAPNTVYVPRLNVRVISGSLPVTNIAIDSSGFIVSGSQVSFPQPVFGIYGKDEGQNVGTGTILNVVGDNVSLSLSGSTLTFSHTNPTIVFPQEVIGIYGTDEGIPVGTGSVLDVVGDNLSLSRSGTVLTLLHTNPTVSFPQEVIGVMGQDEGVPLGTGSTLNVVGDNIALSISGTVLQLTHTDPPFPQELIGFYGQNKAINLGTGTILNVNGSRLVMTLSGTVFDLSNSPDPQEVVGLVGMNKSSSLGTGTTLNVSGTRITLTKNGDVLELTNSPDPQELIGLYGLSNGVPLGTGTSLDFGNNLTASLSGSVLRVDASAGGQFSGVDQIGIYGHDEGIPQGTGTILNVTGQRANLSLSGTVLNLNISPDPQELIGVALQNEGNFLATGVTIDVMGAVTISGSVVNLRVPKTIAFTNSATAGGVVFTNLVANDTTYLGVVADLTGYTQCKLGGVFGAAALATASGTIVHIQWATGSSYASLTELALNPATEQGRLRWIASTQRATDWFDIHPGAAYRDVGLHLRITGGNGTADPNLLGLVAEFR